MELKNNKKVISLSSVYPDAGYECCTNHDEGA